MATLIDLEPRYANSYFGNVNTIIWFEVTDNYGPFSVELRIQRNKSIGQTVQVTNTNNINTVVWNKQYSPSTNPQAVIDVATIWHNSQTNSAVYSIQNI